MGLEVIFHVLIAFGALQAIFLSIILITSGEKLSFRLFAFFLLIEGLTLVERLLAETNLTQEVSHLLGISYPLSFLKPPILWLLALVVTRADFRMAKHHLLHFMPFLLMLGLNIPFYLLPAEEKVQYVATFIGYVPDYTEFNFWFFLSFFCYIAVYLMLSIKVLRHFRIHIKNNRLANGFLQVLYLYSCLLGLQLLHFVLRPSGIVEFPYVNEASMLTMTFLIQSIAYQLLSKSRLLNDPTSAKISSESATNNLEAQAVLEKLEKDRVFLDDRLSLEAFAGSLDMSKKKMSDIFNQRFGSSFKRVINEYRVKEAKSLMAEKKNLEGKLVEIGLRSGFNNKVSFYRTFKQITGKSPSDYHKSLHKRSS